MLTPQDLAQIKPGLRDDATAVSCFMALPYNHQLQSRSPINEDGLVFIFESDTTFDGERR